MCLQLQCTRLSAWAGQCYCVAASRCCPCGTKTATRNLYREKYSCFPNQLYGHGKCGFSVLVYLSFSSYFFSLFFSQGLYIVQANLKLVVLLWLSQTMVILLPQPLGYWDSRHMPPHLATLNCLKMYKPFFSERVMQKQTVRPLVACSLPSWLKLLALLCIWMNKIAI